MGYLYVMMGVIISSAVIPATLTIMWAGHNKWAATLTPPLGLACAVITWLVTAKKTCGALDVTCTGSNNPMLAGNVMALLSPLIFTPLFTLIFGVDHYVSYNNPPPTPHNLAPQITMLIPCRTGLPWLP
jgi:Na+/proline symporter